MCAWRVKLALYTFLHERVSQCLLVRVKNDFQEFLFNCNKVDTIVSLDDGRDAATVYKSLNPISQLMVSFDDAISSKFLLKHGKSNLFDPVVVERRRSRS